MTKIQNQIFSQVAKLKTENARMRVALTEILFRCERIYWSKEMCEIRDVAKKALEPANGTLTIKKGNQ